jgi:DNA-binding Xre family transcriptional regulator
MDHENNWAHDPDVPFERKITRWTYETILKQREISLGDIGEEEGISKQAVHLWMDGLTSALRTETIEGLVFRLDRVISDISSKRHDSVPHTYCVGHEALCIPILLTSQGDLRAAEAKFLGELEKGYERY